MEKMLLTGASGFLGRNFMECLDKSKYEVFAVGRNCPQYLDKEHFFTHDLKDYERVLGYIREVCPDILVLLAWDVSTQSYWESFENCLWADVCIRMAQMFLDCGGRQILFAGTSASYDYGRGWLKEQPGYEQPSSLYGISKRYASQALQKLAKRHDAVYCEARLFAIYGKYEKMARLVPLTAWRLSHNEKIINECGELLRDYIYIEDAVRAIHLLIREKASGVYNVSSGRPVSIGQIIMQIAGELDRRELIEFQNNDEEEEYPLIVGDNAKLRGLGFVCVHSLESGIAHALEWMKKEGKL